MDIKDYLKNNPKEYDFSNEGANKYYCNIENGVEKFFAYMLVVKQNKFKGNELAKNKLEKIGNVLTDPDNRSSLMQEIYKTLWSVENANMKKCSIISGETLNSANTTVGRFYKEIEKELYKSDRNIKIHPPYIYYILHDYLTLENSQIINQIIHSKELEEFVKCYHTIGNFMPVPVGCNCPRGVSSKIGDYWDLTLLYIYNYYIKGDKKGISYILNEYKNKNWLECTIAKLYIGWLNDYGEGEEGWHNFIEKNYLDAFVNEKKFPKELWKGHFDIDSNGEIISVFPKGESESKEYEGKSKCIEFFANARKCIMQRGEQMLKVLNEKINK